MTRNELIAAVPVHHRDGHPFCVDLSEIPQPWRDQFWTALYGCQMPVVDGIAKAAYAADWAHWVCGAWRGVSRGPEGLQP